MGRTLEVHFKDIARCKLTVTKERVTFKFPAQYQHLVDYTVLREIYAICEEFIPITENSMRGRFKPGKTTLCMQYDNGSPAKSIAIYGLVKETSNG